jgi:hypothetical protein
VKKKGYRTVGVALAGWKFAVSSGERRPYNYNPEGDIFEKQNIDNNG